MPKYTHVCASWRSCTGTCIILAAYRLQDDCIGLALLDEPCSCLSCWALWPNTIKCSEFPLPPLKTEKKVNWKRYPLGSFCMHLDQAETSLLGGSPLDLEWPPFDAPLTPSLPRTLSQAILPKLKMALFGRAAWGWERLWVAPLKRRYTYKHMTL